MDNKQNWNNPDSKISFFLHQLASINQEEMKVKITSTRENNSVSITIKNTKPFSIRINSNGEIMQPIEPPAIFFTSSAVKKLPRDEYTPETALTNIIEAMRIIINYYKESAPNSVSEVLSRLNQILDTSENPDPTTLPTEIHQIHQSTTSAPDGIVTHYYIYESEFNLVFN